MPLTPGTVIGRYEIESLIAVGGMGEVYRARDHELHRAVALKFLSPEFTSKPDRLSRFVQEARAASALNHPNIVTVYEIGKHEDSPFIATELIEGVTLREFAKKPIKLRDMLDIAIQIASALVAAHEANIVHRDIKPDNIMVRRDGYVKVLDFGLAKPIESIFPNAESEAQTMALALVKTERGALMGTVSYMSPEQARGADLDARTDIWSLGAVLYEMTTGHPPFSGKTPSHIIVSIIEDELPDVSASVNGVPQALEWILMEALTKDREERTQTAKEMLSKLRRLKQRIESGAELDVSLTPPLGRSTDGGTGSQQSGRARTADQQKTTARSGDVEYSSTRPVSSAEYIAGRIHAYRRPLSVVLGAVIVAAVGLAFLLYRWSSNPPLVMPSPMKISRLTNDGKSALGTISPDGKYVAHIYREGDKQSVLLRQTAATTSRELVAPTDGYFLGLSFSSDGNYLFYVKGERGSNVRALYQVSLIGNDSRQLIYDVDSEVAQSPDGKKLAYIRGYFKEKEKALFIANADGSGEERLTTRRAPEFTAMDHPAWSPDGTRVAFVVSGDDANGYYVNIDEFDVQRRTEGKISAERWRYITSIAWLKDGSGVLAVARDRASLAGSPPQIWLIRYPGGSLERITSDVNYYLDFSLTADCKTLVATASAQTSSVVVLEEGDSNRAREIISKSFTGVTGLEWTADGRIVFSSAQRENRDVYIANADGSDRKQLTFDPGGDFYPTFTSDGRYIVFMSNRGGHWGVWRMNADGSNAVELSRTDGEEPAPRISPDGRWVFFPRHTGGRQVVWKISIDGGTPVQLNNEEMSSLSVSPDGKLLAYYHRPPEFNSPVQVQIVSADNGQVVKTLPVLGDGRLMSWSPDGKSLDYVETRDGVSNLMRAPVNGGQPRQLTNWNSDDQIFWFSWSPDGKRLICVRGSNVRDLILIEDLNLVQ